LTLSNDYGLSGDKINVILDYALKKGNNKLFKDNIITYLSPYFRSGKTDIYALFDSLYDNKSFNEVKAVHQKDKNIKNENKKKEDDASVKTLFEDLDYDI